MSTSLLFAFTNALLYAANPKSVWHYKRRHGRLPNVAHPQSYSERMLWRKLVDHNPLFVEFTDKLACKDYCQRLCPDLAVPKTLWVGNDADDIPASVLEGDVFVKANHGYNFNYSIRQGQVDRAELKRTTGRWLAAVHGRRQHQWAYSHVKPRLFVEESIGDATGDLIEINIRASNGRAILGSVIGHNKTPEQWSVYLDTAGNPMPAPGDADDSPPKQLPSNLSVMDPYRKALSFASALSAGVDYARFDFMWNGTHLYAGEITVYPSAGVHELANTRVRELILRGWDLRSAWFLRTRQRGPKRLYAAALAGQLSESPRSERAVADSATDAAGGLRRRPAP